MNRSDNNKLSCTCQWETTPPDTMLSRRIPLAVPVETPPKEETRSENEDDEVERLTKECEKLRQLIEALTLKNRVLEKRLTGLGWSCE